MSKRPKGDFWRKWVTDPLNEFDMSGDGVYAAHSSNPINASLTTNPFGYSSRTDAAIGDVDFSRYPLDEIQALTFQFATHLGLRPDEVRVGAGIDGLIAELIRGIFAQGDRLVMSKVTFPNAAFITRICGGSVDFAEMQNEIRYDLGAMRDLYVGATKAIYLANPNNPTGEVLEPSNIIEALYHPHKILVVDEANIEFGGKSCIAYIKNHPNLIVLRTFSKAYGLAGMRIGYVCGHPELLRLIDRSRPPFPVTNVACAAAAASLEDQDHLKASVRFVRQERRRIVDALECKGFFVCDGAANSILCRRRDNDADLSEEFDHAGVTVASGRMFGLANHWCRIAPQKTEDNDAMIRIIEKM